MNRILVIGATGQIGVELVPVLREMCGAGNVVAAEHAERLPDDIRTAGPFTSVDVTDYGQVEAALREFNVDAVFHLASVLSALAETRRQQAYRVNFNGLYNVLEASLANGVKKVIVPSSIAAFGPESPRDSTPNDTVQMPTTIYGISKVLGELMGNYYQAKLGLEVRGVRLPGIVSWKAEPTAGTTDYAVEIFHGAIEQGHYTSYLKPDTYLPMMYMPDAIRALTMVAEADSNRLLHHADFNVNSMSFTPAQLADAIKAKMPDFTIGYDIDPMRQDIADSWPNSLDDSAARAEWDWRPHYNLDAMVDDMLMNLRTHLQRIGTGPGGNEARRAAGS